MKRILFALLALVSLTGLRAEVIDLGAMELNVEYTLEDFKAYKGQFTAPKSGVLTCESTTTDDMRPFTSAECDDEHLIEATYNNYFGPHTYDFNVEEGKTYYFYVDFILNSGTVFKLKMEGDVELTLEASTPALGAAYHVSNGGQIDFDFNKAVNFESASITLAGNTQALQGQVYNNSIFFNDVKDIVWNALTTGAVKPGDEFVITIQGVCMQNDPTILYGGTGTFEAHFTFGPMPVTLESTENTSGNFLSYYTSTNSQGIVSLTFSGPISTDKMQATLRYGDIYADADNEYYAETLTPTLSEDKKTVYINLQGKRRKAADMVGSGTNYGIMTLAVTGVCDENGNYTYVGESGAMGSYWYMYNFVEVEADVVADFTPAEGASLDNCKEIEIWVVDESALTYDGLRFTYTRGGEAGQLDIPASQLRKVVDPEDASAVIITLDVPAELVGTQDIALSFINLESADGKDYNDVLTVHYSGLTDAIEAIAVRNAQGNRWNLNGQRTDNSRGIVIRQGHKYFQ